MKIRTAISAFLISVAVIAPTAAIARTAERGKPPIQATFFTWQANRWQDQWANGWEADQLPSGLVTIPSWWTADTPLDYVDPSERTDAGFEVGPNAPRLAIGRGGVAKSTVTLG